MPTYDRIRDLPYTPEQMFDLVIDVERYPEFVPGYLDVRITRRDGDTLYVDQTIGFAAARVKFESVAETSPPERISINSTTGPFKRLSVDWQFTAEPNGCNVHFVAGYELSAGPLGFIIQRWFDESSGRILDAFIRRAHGVYGG
jgi:coenzyme Q-binding protein COQ10